MFAKVQKLSFDAIFLDKGAFLNNFFSELKRRNVVRVAIAYVIVGWVILQFVDVIADPMSLPEWFQRVTIILLAILFPIVLIFSWAFEVTPEGVKKTKEVDASKSITHGTGQRINKLIGGALVLALGFIAYDKMIATDDPGMNQAEAGRVTIAVLPFSDLSPEGDQEYFGDGIAEEILNVLVKADGLKVTSRSSSFSFKGQNLDIPTMAERLGVNNILEGSVRKSGNQVRITAQLIDVASDTHLWSETFDRDISDVFQVQNEIARAIGQALEVQFGVGPGVQVVVAQTLIPEAHEEYLKGRFFWNRRTISQLYEAEKHFRRAVELDPNYAIAHLGLAETLILIPGYEPAKRDFRPEYEGAELSARRALELDPTLGQAHTTLGFVLLERGRFIEAKAEYQKGIEMAPDYGTAWQWYGNFESNIGRQDAGEALMLKAREIDPLSPIILSNYIDNLIIGNKISLAQEELENALALFPDFAFFYYSEAFIRLYENDYEGAREAFRKYAPLDKVDPRTLIGWVDLIEIYETTGEQGPLSDDLKESIAKRNIYSSPFELIFAAGYQEEAVDFFSSGRTEFGFDTGFLYFLWQPNMRSFINLREVKDVLIEVGMLEFWKADGWPDMCRPLGDSDFECSE